MSGEIKQVFSSESVTPGHPDKLTDFAIAHCGDRSEEESQKYGGHGRYGIEAAVKGSLENGGTVFLTGEVTLPKGATFDPDTWVREAVREIGYTPSAGFSDQAKVIIEITPQSKNIDHGVTKRNKKLGYGDQGIFIGGAVIGDGPNFMPMPIMVARSLTRRMYEAFQTKELPWIRPDGKSLVGVQYVNGVPVRITNITLAASHDPLAELGYVKEELRKKIIAPISDEFHLMIDTGTKIEINGAGKWTIYGPLADSGVGNRKIVVETYGGWCPIGGGGLDGKDPTKGDVSLNAAARWLPLWIVKSDLAKIAHVQMACTIGRTRLDSLVVNTFGTGKYPDDVLANLILKKVDFSIGTLIERFKMYDQKMGEFAKYGWMGNPNAPWEKTPSESLAEVLGIAIR